MNRREAMTMTGAAVAAGAVGLPAFAEPIPSALPSAPIVVMTESRAYPVDWKPGVYDASSPTMDRIVDAEFSGKAITHIELTPDAYRTLRKDDAIECERCSVSGTVVVRKFMGYRIKVPGTALS